MRQLTCNFSVRQATLSALAGWPKHRARLPAARAGLLAAAWWAGNRNVAELARAADTARDTVYRDLRARGIDPAGRFQPPGDRPRYTPLRFEAVGELASLMATVLLPLVIGERTGPLESAAWQMSKAMTQVADLVNKNKADSSPTRAENAEELAYCLFNALTDANAYWASIQSNTELGERAQHRQYSACELEAIVTGATLTVGLPDTSEITVTLRQTSYKEPDAGFTTLTTDSPLVTTGIDGKDHLDLRTALDLIAEVLSRHLAEDAFGE